LTPIAIISYECFQHALYQVCEDNVYSITPASLQYMNLLKFDTIQIKEVEHRHGEQNGKDTSLHHGK